MSCFQLSQTYINTYDDFYSEIFTVRFVMWQTGNGKKANFGRSANFNTIEFMSRKKKAVLRNGRPRT